MSPEALCFVRYKPQVLCLSKKDSGEVVFVKNKINCSEGMLGSQTIHVLLTIEKRK